jgi:Flp pilus assembly protein TadD
MKNSAFISTLPAIRRTFFAQRARFKRVARHAGMLACGVTLLWAATGCTTTTTQHLSVNSTSRVSSPSDQSELRIADTALDSGNLDMATTVYERIVKSHPNSVEGLTGLGNTLYAVGDFTRAGVYYDKANAVDAKAVGALIGQGRVAIHQRRLDDAIATYHRLLVVVPNDPTAVAGLGAAIDLKGDHAAAQAVLRDGLKHNPGDPTLSVNLGLSLILGGNPREGANVLLDVTRYPAAPSQARQDLALAYGLLGNTEAAAEILSQDLPKASVQDNLRFYAIQRSRLPSPSASSDASALPNAAVQTSALP